MTAGQTDKTEGNLENVLAHCMTRQGTATTTKCANILTELSLSLCQVQTTHLEIKQTDRKEKKKEVKKNIDSNW